MTEDEETRIFEWLDFWMDSRINLDTLQAACDLMTFRVVDDLDQALSLVDKWAGFNLESGYSL